MFRLYGLAQFSFRQCGLVRRALNPNRRCGDVIFYVRRSIVGYLVIGKLAVRWAPFVRREGQIRDGQYRNSPPNLALHYRVGDYAVRQFPFRADCPHEVSADKFA